MNTRYIVCSVEKKEAPSVDILELEKEEEKEQTPWRLILYDDEIHTFD